MTRFVVLDTGVLGLLTHPMGSPESLRCVNWFTTLASAGVVFVLPEIADYELRREILRTGRATVVRRLDQLKALVRYEPITTTAMLEAARLWAWVRNQGHPTADPKALDGDVILAGQVAQLAPVAEDEEDAGDIVIATTNVRHLALFGHAQLWHDIQLPA
jgi:predicted nucleic acid-binding protein